MALKEVFTVDGVEYAVIRPNHAGLRAAARVYNKVFNEALDDGANLRERLNEILRKQGLWSDEKEEELKAINKTINTLEATLAGGNIKKSQGKELALELKRTRASLRRLLSATNSLDNATAQGQADDARFNQLVSTCTVYNKDGKPVFSSLDDYLSRNDTEVSRLAATKLASMMFGVDSDYESKLPENKFLLKFGYVNSDLEFIDDKGRLVDSQGRLVNKEGRFVDEEGNFVDGEGNRVDEKGDLVVEEKPFLDDDGNPIV